MMILLFIGWMAFLSRAAGGGWPAPWLKDKTGWDGEPELFFGMTFAVIILQITGQFWLACIVTLWSYAWMETGHGDVLQWGDGTRGSSSRHPLCFVVDPAAKLLGFKPYDINYCRLFMSVKGFLIGLPVGGLPLAILWPLSYEIGHRVRKPDGLDEMLAGASAGISILLFLYFWN